ncbi:MAG: tetratricopeptide repeat protein [Spartobacteria bacterium]
MTEKIKRVRRRRRIRSFANLGDLGQRFQPRQLGLLVGAIIVASALVLIFLNYGTQAYHNWRESRLLKRASALLEHNDFDGATRAAQQALELHRDSLPVFQILAEATEKQNRIETVAWRAQIARLLPNNLDSHLNLASAALRFGELDTARKALERVSPNDRDRAAYHVVAGWLARAQGDEAGLQQHFAAALRQEPNNELFQFNLAVLQIKSADAEKREAARGMLERLSKTVPFRTGALRALLSDAVVHGYLPAADGLAQDLQMSQQVTFGDYLLCLDLYRKLDEKKFNALLEKVKPVAARQATDLASLMNWMNSNGLAADVLKWTEILPSDLTTLPPPAIAVAEAFAQVKNWSRLKRWTRGGSWNDSDYIRLAYQAYASRQMRQGSNDAEFDSAWRSAEHAANDQPQRELILARFAQKWNLTIEAEQLWLRIVKNTAARREALDALSRIYRARNDLPNLYRTMQRLHEASPGDAGTAANFARLALLLEQNASEGHRVAHEAYEHAPNDLNCGMTYAFSLYGLGRTAEGIELMKKFPPEQLHESHAAVYAAVLLVDENLFDAAKEYIDAARRGPLFSEEKKLLEEVTAKVASATATPPAPSASPSPTPPESPTPASTP